MLTTIDDRVLASINLFAVIGAIPELIRRVPEASGTVADLESPASIGFAVHNGPRATLTLSADGGSIAPGSGSPARPHSIR